VLALSQPGQGQHFRNDQNEARVDGLGGRAGPNLFLATPSLQVTFSPNKATMPAGVQGDSLGCALAAL